MGNQISIFENGGYDPSATRRMIHAFAKNISDSYNHEWDILAELIQNSVDAIEDNELIAEGLIEITFDCSKKLLKVRDNGCGVSPDDFKNIFRPNFTLKSGKIKLRGEKGVGLTFIVLSTDNLEVFSQKDGSLSLGVIRNGYSFVNDFTFSAQPPILEYDLQEKDVSENSFTEIVLQGVPNNGQDGNIFDYTSSKLKYILRTRTAIGNTASLFGEDPPKPIKVVLNYTGSDGVKNSPEILEYSFDAPHLRVKNSITYSDLQSLKSAGKEKSAQGKSFYGSVTRESKSKRKVKIYFFVASRSIFDRLSKDVLGEEDSELTLARLYLSTKQMPTGIYITPPKSGVYGYWSNLYIIFEYDELKLDIGRKSISPRVRDMLSSFASELFKELTKHISVVVPAEVDEAKLLAKEAALEKLWEEADSSLDLSYKGLSTKKEPLYEQGVIALFYELIGRGVISDYKTFLISSVSQYDCLMKLDRKSNPPSKLVCEFKLEASSIINEFFESDKDYAKIRLLVCWSINIKKFIDNNFEVDEINSEEGSIYTSANYKIRIPQIATPLYVICLKEIVQKL